MAHGIVLAQETFLVYIDVMMVSQHLLSWLLRHREAIVTREAQLLLNFALLELNEALLLLKDRLADQVFYLAQLVLELLPLSLS